MPTIEQLDASHRAEQATNASDVAKTLIARWLLLVDPDNIAVSSRSWLAEAVTAILQGRERAYTLASAYALAVRRIQIPGATPIHIPKPPPPPLEKIQTSLVYTGVRDLAIKLGRIPEPIDPADTFSVEPVTESDRERYARERESWRQMRQKAMEVSGAKAAASAYKEVVNGARDTTDELVRTNTALGYMRITKAKPCAFCLMLASRGPVYREDSFDQSNVRFTGPGQHKVHDTCGCTLRPLFERGEENWTDTARKADDVWRNGTGKPGEKPPASYSGQEAINAFARATRALGIADLTRW